MSQLRIPVSPRDHGLGSDDAPLTLVEYGDYQCPSCGAAHPRVKRLLQALAGDLRLVFRHFPLTQIHEYAFLGAMAAEAAGEQGKFWEMHDLIFGNQEFLDAEGVLVFAERLELDRVQFRADLDAPHLKTRIQEDFMGGVRSGVNGTPTFFLNERRLAGLPDAGELGQVMTGRQ